jgi:hypothetical protein
MVFFFEDVGVVHNPVATEVDDVRLYSTCDTGTRSSKWRRFARCRDRAITNTYFPICSLRRVMSRESTDRKNVGSWSRLRDSGFDVEQRGRICS